mgnify:CR=1 FL=1
MSPNSIRLIFILLAALLSGALPFFFFSFRAPDDLFFGIWQSIFVYAVFLLILPMAFVRFVLREPAANFGLQVKRLSRKDAAWFAVLFLSALAVTFLAAEVFDTQAFLKPPEFALVSFWLFLLFVVLLHGIFTFFYEVFFRGFLLLGTARSLGHWSILLSFFAFLVFLWASGTLGWQNVPVIISSLFAGVLAYRTRSILWSFLFSFFFGILVSIASAAL